MSKRWLIYGVLLLLALFSWSTLQIDIPEPALANKKIAHDLDFFSTGYSKIELDELGKYKNKVVASKLTHFPGDDSYQLDDPVISIFNNGAVSWELKAKKGWLSVDNNLLLRSDVVVTRRQSADHRAIRLDTSSLLFKFKQNYAETDDKVVILMTSDITEGVGMQIYFTQPIHLKLLTKVKSKYGLK